MDAAVAARQPLLALLSELQQAVAACFDGYRRSVRQHDPPEGGLPLRRLQLGLELMCKLEEQLLHPALGASRAEAWPALGRAMGEVDRLRDLSILLGRAADSHRMAALAALQGLAAEHFSALAGMLEEAESSSAALPWTALEDEVRGLLARWKAEVQQHGEIEDEDGDPVGAPPR